jgi:hypothetical protein
MNSRGSEHYEDSQDMIARIRKLRVAAEKKMNAFGDPSDYDVRLIHGRKSERETDANANSEDSQ